MLTPSGLGKEFRVTGKPYRPAKRRNRGRRRLIAVLVVVVVLGAGGWSTYRYGPFGGTSVGAEVCPHPSVSATSAALQPVPVQPGQITLNVLNATKRTGLAHDTVTLLKQRGFTLATPGNDNEVVPGPALVRSGPGGLAARQLVLAQVQGAQPVTDNRPDASVDLVLGNGFVALQDPAAAAALPPTPTPQAAASPAKGVCR